MNAARDENERPSLLICKTTIGKGASTKEGTAAAHGAPLGGDDLAALRTSLSFDGLQPFELSEGDRGLWRVVAERGEALKAAWKMRMEKAPEASAFKDRITRSLPDGWMRKFQTSFDPSIFNEAKATRQWSGTALKHLKPSYPWALGRIG